MNLARGFKRALVVASAAYWLAALAIAKETYDFGARRLREDASGRYVFRVGTGFEAITPPEGNSPPCQRALAYLEASIRADHSGKIVAPGGCRDQAAILRTLEHRSGLTAARKSLTTAAAIYASIAAAGAALWWVIAGFRSPRAPQ